MYKHNRCNYGNGILETVIEVYRKRGKRGMKIIDWVKIENYENMKEKT